LNQKRLKVDQRLECSALSARPLHHWHIWPGKRGLSWKAAFDNTEQNKTRFFVGVLKPNQIWLMA